MRKIQTSTISKILVSEYELTQSDLKITEIKTGVENNNYLVTDSTNKFVLRVYNDLHSIRGSRDINSIKLEMSFMQKAQKSKINSPNIIKNKSRKLFSAIELNGNKKFIALFKFSEGKMKHSFNSKRAEEVGKVVNNMFNVGHSFSFINALQSNNIVDRAFDKFNELSNSNINKNNQNYTKLAKLRNLLKQDYLKIQNTKPLKGLVHGDLKLENLLFFENDEISAVLDFDDYRFSFLIEEAVMALMHNLHSQTANIIRSGNYNSFVKEIINPKLKKEFKQIVFFLKIRFLYDLSKYLITGNNDLVSELWEDKYIKKFI